MMAAASIARKVIFYRLWETDADDPLPDGTLGPTFCEEIRRLPQRERLVDWDTAEGRRAVAWPMDKFPFPVLRFSTVRTTAFPEVYNVSDGSASPLTLAEDDGLLESIYCVFFPDGVVGVDYNYLGPRVPQLARYARLVFGPSFPSLRANVLIQPDILEQFERYEEITVAEIAFAPSQFMIDARTTEERTFFGAAQTTTDIFDGFEVKMAVRGNSGATGRGLGPRGVAFVRQLLGRTEITDGGAKRFRIQGYTQDSRAQIELDLLSEKLMSTVTVARIGKNRAVEGPSIIGEIIRVRQERREEISRAAEAVLLLSSAADSSAQPPAS